MTGKRFILVVIVVATAFGAGSPVSLVHARGDTQVPVLVLLRVDDSQQLEQVQALIEAAGGRSLHTFPYRAVIATVSDETIQSLKDLPGVATVLTQTVDPSAVDGYGANSRQLANVWNSLLASQSENLETRLTTTQDVGGHDDAFVAPDLPPADWVARTAGTSVTPGYYQTSEYMAGSVAVGVVLVESDGSADPSTEDWTFDERQQVFDEIVAGLNWWADLEPRANLSFVYDDHFSDPLPTSVEPISRPYLDQQYWIADAMGALGYSAPSFFARVRDYNHNLRTTYETDWVFTIFVVDSSADYDNRFSDDYFAYAYLGGPFLVMTYGNSSYGPGNMDAVIAHEVGHIFRALDQHSSAQRPCTHRSGYLDVENQNSQYGDCVSDMGSIMRGGTYPYTVDAIDPYAAGQVGWRDSDDDGILDPLDTDLPIGIESVLVNGFEVTVSGRAEIVPFPSPSHTSVTINTLTGVQYRIDGGEWRHTSATDGAFDGTTEGFHLTVSLSSGLHTVEVAALDSAGNVSDAYSTELVPVLDPIDGGLNTELYHSGDDLHRSAGATLSGVAYHMQGGIIADVQSRVAGGPWQSVAAQDGAFDSGYEPFSVPIDSLDAGTCLIEARAVDADGNVEVRFASQAVTLMHTAYLPLVLAGR